MTKTTMRTKAYTFYEDPGHAWLAVPLSTLEKLGIDGCISSCSYIRGAIAYLEEDLDAGIFIDAAIANGWELDAFNTVYRENTPIRDYDMYPAAPDQTAQLDKFRGRNQPLPPQGVAQP